MLINIYKNWLNDACVAFMEMEQGLMEENKDLIKKVGFLEME